MKLTSSVPNKNPTLTFTGYISSFAPLDSAAFVQAFDFDFDHLYRFIYKDRLGRTFQFTHPFVDIPPNTSDFRLRELPLETGNHLQLTYDLRDEWEFDLQLEKIEPANPKMKKSKILESHGEAPTQYDEEEELY